MYIYKFMIYTHARVPVWVQSPWQNNTVYVEKSEFSLHMCTRSLSELFYKFKFSVNSTRLFFSYNISFPVHVRHVTYICFTLTWNL